jgi:glycosyltransferase involved in cell wall biosynthesis
MTDRVVQLHFGRFVHPVYREQLAAAPAGWRYAGTHPSLADEAAPTKRVIERAGVLGALREPAEAVAMRVLSEAGYVHAVRAPRQAGATLIHSGERLIRRSPLPYVLDFEHASLFVLYQQAALERPWARAVLERGLRDGRLRRLLAWSDAARDSLLAILSPAARAVVEPKLETLTPAVALRVEAPRRRAATGPLRLLFIGTKYYEKGAVEAVRALRAVRATHDVTLDVVTYAPPGEAARLAQEPGLTVHPPGGLDLVRGLYARSDALLFPSHMDTFGWVVCEAMSYGLPVLAPRHLALTETVRDERSGLLFPPENMLYRADTQPAFRHLLPPPRRYLEALRHPSEGYVQGIAAAIARLAEERGLHERLAHGAFDSVAHGALSIGVRRDRLAEIYRAAAA